MSLKFTGAHAAAIVAALCALLILISGALETTAASFTPPFSSGLVSAAGHTGAGEYVGGVLLLMLILVALKESALRGLVFALAAIVAMEGFLGSQRLAAGSSNALGLLHAVLAQVLVAGAVAVVIATASSWKQAPEYVADYGWPSLRSLAVILPVLVLTQVFLGAAFRQHVSGLMPHIIGAILVAMLILIVCAFTLQQCPTHAILRASAKALMLATFTQIFLGIATFTVRVMPKAETGPVLGFTSGHVAVGALTLAASIVLSMQIRRNVVPKGTILPQQAPSNQSSGPQPQG